MACALGKESLEERRTLLKDLTHGIVERRHLDNGMALHFEPESGLLMRLARLVDLERECCEFLGFRISVEQENGPVWLELTGPKDLIDEYCDVK